MDQSINQSKSKRSILFIGKEKDAHCSKALAFIYNNFLDVSVYLGSRGESLPEDIGWWSGDYIISYLSPWIIPGYLLNRSKMAAINFHPASPEYPGIGCNNFALYDGADSYGVTCHYMNDTVDTGTIIATKKFPILHTDNVASLLTRTYDFQLVLFYEIIEFILKDKSLPESCEKWTRKPYTRCQLDELALIDASMNKNEIQKRIRATSFKNYQPCMNIGGYKFTLNGDFS